ncbi:hypothetical protein ADP64_000050 [Achromobacter phage phiAxp-2]|uniref:Uncharacterized protein n=1 Tax=Achromobacter phage phiAxp-2 TaxID=1664246 RepID=A0A0K2FHT6_9CAUD|nr:hypothetical protein ADP64_000050 [Achromobacter phage phiAxp-2]ALA45420.1 hypothetical protein ADP64_000050 [Achromobacter phage phiAxp-2]
MTDQTNTPNTDANTTIDLTAISRVIGFLGMFVAHVECAVGYQYGQQRPATMEGEPDHLDQIMADKEPIVAFMGSGASDALFISDIEAARAAYMELMKVYGIEDAGTANISMQNAPSTDTPQ